MTESPDAAQPDATQPDTAQPDRNQLDDYVYRLAQALQILDLNADHSKVLDAVHEASAAHGDDAGPLTAFYVGYAAGSASPHHEGSDAVDRAAGVARRTVSPAPADNAGGADGTEASGGWAATAQ